MDALHNPKSVVIKQIEYEQTYPIRQVVLRPGRPLETCFFKGDELQTTFHFGLFYQEKLTGIISIFKNNNPLFSQTDQYQIRGMAVLPEYQKSGFGKQLVVYSEIFLRNKSILLVWFNAREIAVDFYKKSGYQVIGKTFEIPDVGPHFVMFKKL
ncbi:MAG: GNAT family N-acetyltransferase [Flavobacteriaceae bacterium]